MHNLNDEYFMMIEPDQLSVKSPKPCDDDFVRKVKFIFNKCIPSKYNFKGFHLTKCGKTSDNKDWILPNGMITNNLCIYYAEYYRHAIPESEIDKVNALYNELKES